MKRSAELVLIGQVLLRAGPAGISTAQGLAVGGGRVLATGTRDEMRELVGPGTRLIEEPGLAVVPGLHDFHLHLVGMARLRREVQLDGLDSDGLLRAVTDAAQRLQRGAWLRGRGWSEAAMPATSVAVLNDTFREQPALLYSHDAHSAWASPAALAEADVRPESADPPGGRIERNALGQPTGVLRESATDLVEAGSPRLRGPELSASLDQVLAELAGWGITGATDAGDTSADNGVGEHAGLGDRASLLMQAAGQIDGRLRLGIGVPAVAMDVAAGHGLVTGHRLAGMETIRAGWAKAYVDGALGSRTAATFDTYTCGGPGETGILRLSPAELDGILANAAKARISVAVHAIGDRAAAAVLDAIGRAPGRGPALPPHRIEHLQLLRPEDRDRLAAMDVTASVQPVHCAADRTMVDECWSDRAELAYPWRSLAAAGTRLAFGSDAPIETPNPWVGLFAAVHRRLPGDGESDWQPAQALDAASALAGYTTGPAASGGFGDEGRLEPGARADLAMLNVDLAALLAADERLAGVRSQFTLVGGSEVRLA